MGLSSFYYKTNTKYKSNRGAQRPRVGVFFESFSFLEAGCSGNHGRGLFLPVLPSVP